MLKAQRPLLPASLQDDLARRQAAVDNGTAGDSPWKEFRAYERKQALRSQPTVKAILIKMFHGKCAYCESKGARDIEHYWPKSPHAQNAHRGSPAVMFRWDNLLWACHCEGAMGRVGEWAKRQRQRPLSRFAVSPFRPLAVSQKPLHTRA